jgi:iron complex outermembrane receptor protein
LFDREFRNIDRRTVNEFEGYATVDLSADIAVLGGVFTTAVQNLANEDYYTYYSQTSPLDARYFKGLGRTFRVGYRKSF